MLNRNQRFGKLELLQGRKLPLSCETVWFRVIKNDSYDHPSHRHYLTAQHKSLMPMKSLQDPSAVVLL